MQRRPFRLFLACVDAGLWCIGAFRGHSHRCFPFIMLLVFLLCVIPWLIMLGESRRQNGLFVVR